RGETQRRGAVPITVARPTGAAGRHGEPTIADKRNDISKHHVVVVLSAIVGSPHAASRRRATAASPSRCGRAEDRPLFGAALRRVGLGVAPFSVTSGFDSPELRVSEPLFFSSTRIADRPLTDRRSPAPFDRSAAGRPSADRDGARGG